MASNRGLASVRSGLPESGGGTARRVKRGPLSWLIVAAFVAFLSSMPFEAALLLTGGGFFSISGLLGYAFFGLAFLQPKLCFRKPPRASWWFALYFGLYVLTGLYQPSLYGPAISLTTVRLTQCLILFWVGYNLLQYERVARWCLWGFSLACVAMAVLLLGGLRVSKFRGIEGRQTLFEQGPNRIASIIGLGAVALIGLAYAKTGARQSTKLLAWAGFLVAAAAITRTGSRGALLGLGMGLMTLLASQGSARSRMRNVLVVVLALAACIWITKTSDTAASRWEAALEGGNLAGRQRIFPAALRMFAEKPIQGWGPVTNYNELGRRFGRPTLDTHNIFLWLLTEQGLLGTIPFCIGLAMCARAAWRSRRGSRGLLPLALFVAVLAVNQSGTYYVTKWFWFVMAYSLASEPRVRLRRAESGLRSANRPGFGSIRVRPRQSARLAGAGDGIGARTILESAASQ
jgi:O-antigen ligase